MKVEVFAWDIAMDLAVGVLVALTVDSTSFLFLSIAKKDRQYKIC